MLIFSALLAASSNRFRASPVLRTAGLVASAASRTSRKLTLQDSTDTLALGARLAEVCQPGDVVLLHGDYGAGKTCLARGFIRRWYADPSELVTSPSYLIDNAYDDPERRALRPGVTVHHMDLWRLPEGKVQQLVDLPKVFSECVSLIEWPDKLGSDLMPSEYLDIDLCILDGGGEEDGEEARAAEAAQAEAEEDEDEEDEDEDEEQPRVAPITARGKQWEERLAVIAAGGAAS